ncbi:MAG TPA: hypothetical protein PLR90_08180 [Methylophilus sp.]|nr:hypothetical protein [Methylophilus sp.]HQQ33881.1 hypothetical protein [Methylophilus sp.]
MATIDQVFFYTIPAQDLARIKDGHLELKRHLEHIHETCTYIKKSGDCTNCSSEKHASCKGRLHSLLIYGVEVAEEHFAHEEAVLLQGLTPTARTARFQAHLAAHEAILKKLEMVNTMCTELNRNVSTAEAYRNLYFQTSAIFNEHERLFDRPSLRHATDKT